MAIAERSIGPYWQVQRGHVDKSSQDSVHSDLLSYRPTCMIAYLDGRLYSASPYN